MIHDCSQVTQDLVLKWSVWFNHKCTITFIWIFGMVSLYSQWFTIIITTVVSHYSSVLTKSQNVSYNARNIFVTKLYRKCSNTFVSHCTYIHVCVNNVYTSKIQWHITINQIYASVKQVIICVEHMRMNNTTALYIISDVINDMCT